MKWTGIRTDTSATDPGMELMENVSLSVDGEVRRRPGLSDGQAHAGTSMSDILDNEDGNYIITAGGATTIKAGNEDSVVTVISGLASSGDGALVKSSGKVYFSNDLDPVQVISSVANVADNGDAGLAEATAFDTAPVESGSGSLPTGDYLVRWRNYNSATGYYGDPSPASTVTVATASKLIAIGLNFSPNNILTGQLDSRATGVLIECTDVGGTVYYHVLTLDLDNGAALGYIVSQPDIIQSPVLDADAGISAGHAAKRVSDLGARSLPCAN